MDCFLYDNGLRHEIYHDQSFFILKHLTKQTFWQFDCSKNFLTFKQVLTHNRPGKVKTNIKNVMIGVILVVCGDKNRNYLNKIFMGLLQSLCHQCFEQFHLSYSGLANLNVLEFANTFSCNLSFFRCNFKRE